MKAQKFFLTLVTAPDIKVARRLARSALNARLAACVNLVPSIESHYWWQGKLDSGAEVLMILKTTAPHLKVLENHILKSHPYDTPEFVTIPISSGNKRYLRWLVESVSTPNRPLS